MIFIANNLKKLKPYLSFLIIILLFLSIGIFTIKGLYNLGNLTRTIYEHPLVVSNASLHAAHHITKMHRSMKDVVLANFSDEIETALRAVSEAELIVFQDFDIIQKNILGKEGQALAQNARQLFVNWQPIRAEVVQLYRSGNKQDAILITKGKGANHVAKLENIMIDLTSYARNKAKGFIGMSEKSQLKIQNVTLILTVAGVFLSLIVAIIATKRLEKEKLRIIIKNQRLRQALDEVKILRGIIPICSICKKIRNDRGAWEKLEAYISERSDAKFSHGYCPECFKTQMEEISLKSRRNKLT